MSGTTRNNFTNRKENVTFTQKAKHTWFAIYKQMKAQGNTKHMFFCGF